MNNSKLSLGLLGVLHFTVATTCFGAEETCSFIRGNISPNEFDANASVEKVAQYIKSASEDYLGKIKGASFEGDVSGFVSACKILGVELTNMSVSLGVSIDDIETKQKQKNKELTDSSQSCVHGILYSLNYEIKKFEKDEKCSALNKVIGEDIVNVNTLKSMNDKSISLVKKEVNPDLPIKNFTPEQLKAIQEKGDFSSIASENTYYSVMELGVSFMPEYDSEGNNNGFKESNFLGALRLSNRMKGIFSDRHNWVSYQGLDVLFYSAPIACVAEPPSDGGSSSDSNSSSGSNSSPADCTKEAKPISKLKFADISNTVNASVYASALYNNAAKFGGWEFGPSVRYGVLNREKKGSDGDSVAKFYNYGIEIRLNDFWGGDLGSKYHNGLPKFLFNYSEGSNEDYAGTGLKTDRKLASFSYRLFDNQPVLLGLVVDGGKGPDTIALNLTYGLKSSSIFGLFAD